MADVSNKDNQGIEQLNSRRKMFKWLGLIGTGASLAALGLRNPLKASAAPAPYCNPATCDSCTVTECAVHNTCPNQPKILVYYTKTACSSTGCVSINYSACLNSCACP